MLYMALKEKKGIGASKKNKNLTVNSKTKITPTPRAVWGFFVLG